MNISTFPMTGKPRRRDLVACKNLYFRIGVGPSTGPGKRSIPGYDDEALAESALEAFVRDAPLPQPTMIVGCGDELQVYWSFAKIFTPNEFDNLSRALALAGRRLGLKFHAASTRNPCCLMRIPGTHNYQLDPPARITLRMIGVAVTMEEMCSALHGWLMEGALAGQAGWAAPGGRRR
jgi:hypothetical protein